MFSIKRLSKSLAQPKNFLIIILCTCLFACLRPYQPDIQQGNILNNSNLREIEYGMSKQEVLFLLGTPLVSDPFNLSRWDYYYSNINQNKKEAKERLITVIFEGDKLVNVTSDVDINSLNRLEPSTEDKQHGGTIITKPTQKEKGIWNRLFNPNKPLKTQKKEENNNG